MWLAVTIWGGTAPETMNSGKTKLLMKKDWENFK
jgi:hypothetical protein